ncbi:MAG: hypothetical protein ACYDIE_11050, partial [Candidatus Krumholzibacteriia bacterium]
PLPLARVAAPGAPTVAREASIGGHVIDGSYVMNIGELQVNITNFGLIGSQYTDVSTYSDAPSGRWPAGSGNEYLQGAGLWIGGLCKAQRCVSTGLYDRELRPLNRVQDTIYEARNEQVVRPAGNPGIRGRRRPQPGCDDVGDGRIDEEILNGFDDDDDGLVDDDFAQLGQQMMVCTMYENTPVSREQYPDHVPMDRKVVQTSFGWDAPDFRNFTGLSYTITNIGAGARRRRHLRLPQPGHPRQSGRVPAVPPERGRSHRRAGHVREPARLSQPHQHLFRGRRPGAGALARRHDRPRRGSLEPRQPQRAGGGVRHLSLRRRAGRPRLPALRRQVRHHPLKALAVGIGGVR